MSIDRSSRPQPRGNRSSITLPPASRSSWPRQSIDRALGVHSYSKLHYTLPGEFSQLRFRYALPDDQRAGNVSVRAYVGDKVAYEKADVTAGALSDVVTLDLSGAKSIALEVDYGKNYDVQDDLNWIDAAVTR